MITTDKLKAWKELSEKATPGPWIFERVSHEPDYFTYERNDDTGYISICENDYNERMKAKFDSDFIAASRTAVPELIAEVERLLMLQKQDEIIKRLGSTLKKASIALTKNLQEST